MVAYTKADKNIDINLLEPEEITISNLPCQIFRRSLNNSKYLLILYILFLYNIYFRVFFFLHDVTH